jgi:hypothetical protein
MGAVQEEAPYLSNPNLIPPEHIPQASEVPTPVAAQRHPVPVLHYPLIGSERWSGANNSSGLKVRRRLILSERGEVSRMRKLSVEHG